MSKVFEIVTQRIIAMLEKGVIPWRRPWKGTAPQNLITRKPYRGINAFILGFSGGSYFLTFNQAKALGAHVKKGAQGLPVVFWKFREHSKQQQDDENAESSNNRPAPILRYYTVFRIEDIEGIPQNKLPEILNAPPVEPITQAERSSSKCPKGPLFITRATGLFIDHQLILLRSRSRSFSEKSRNFIALCFTNSLTRPATLPAWPGNPSKLMRLLAPQIIAGKNLSPKWVPASCAPLAGSTTRLSKIPLPILTTG